MEKTLIQFYAETREALHALLVALNASAGGLYEYEGRFYCRFCDHGKPHHGKDCPIGTALAVLAQEKCSSCGSESVYYHAGPASLCNACFSR